MSHATRRRTANIPVTAPIAATVTPAPAAAPLARPSGRFEALVDMGNPMKGINLFPYLRRRMEGRALAAMGPAAVLELSRTVREAVLPQRWPREVFCFLLHLHAASVIMYGLASHHVSCKASGIASSDRRAINPANTTNHVA